jgi:EXLDI family protein
MELVKLHRDHDKDVMFMGERLAKVSSRRSDSTRWTEIRLYRTSAGNYVASIVGRTTWEDEQQRYSVALVGSDADKLINALRDEHGQLGWLAKEALIQADIDFTEFIE